jgi:hypothetical protein
VPAKSKSQQRLMGMVYSYKNGDLKKKDVKSEELWKKIKDISKGISKKDAEDFASTKHKNKPEKVNEKTINKKMKKRFNYLKTFENFNDNQEIVQNYVVGDEVVIDSDNENYDDFKNQKLIITKVSKSSEEHPGYDEGVGEALYDLVTDDGDDVPFSLYDYELKPF